jgi:hypothetical protein
VGNRHNRVTRNRQDHQRTTKERRMNEPFTAEMARIVTAQERERIIKLLDQFWCQEIACIQHPVRMDWVIAAIKGKNK